MGRLYLGLTAVLLAAACGDPPICQSEVFVAVQTSHVTSDLDGAAPGVQADIRVRTSLAEGELVTLELLSDAGEALGTTTTEVDGDGIATFAKVTVEAPATRVRASVDVLCGAAEDEIVLEVTAGAGCDLTLDPPPIASAFYAPRDVLNRATDGDPLTLGHQSTIVVATRPGFTVEIFELTSAGEASIATLTASAETVELARTIDNGEVAYRAVCTSASTSLGSATAQLFVDTTAPACQFLEPAANATITPGSDTDPNLAGIQLAVIGEANADDVEGEPAELVLAIGNQAPASIAMQPIDEDGRALPTSPVTIDPALAPVTVTLTFSTRDHAGNPCSTASTHDLVTDGCDIAVVGPTGVTTLDADGNPASGSQIDVDLQVSTECAGRQITSTCGGTTTAAGDGSATVRTTVCETSPCETTTACTFTVVNDLGVPTSAAANLQFDDLGPATTLAIVDPVLACGAQITPASDADLTTDGVQVRVRVDSAGATTKRLDVTTGAGTVSFDAANDVIVTLAAGANQLRGVGLDAFDNQGFSAACAITLADITVSFAPPAADGLMSRADGTISGNQVTFPLCGTVSRTGTTVDLAIDGAPAVPATVTGTTWCRTVTLDESPPSHTIIATATAGSAFGSASLVLRIDLTAPPALANLVVAAPDRTQVHVTWNSPSDGGQPVVSYLAKLAFTPITEANFDTTGIVVPLGAPAPVGTPEGISIDPADVEVSYFFAIATFDVAGNRTLTIAPPVKPSFVRTGAITPPDPSAGILGLGTAVVHGKFNDDDFDDVAISAPTEDNTNIRAGAVYVYFGGPNGIATVPDAIFESTVQNARFGSGLAAVRWTSATRDDLVVGAPGLDQGRGRIFVFAGGFTAGSHATSESIFDISVNAAQPGVFQIGGVGTTLARADVDGDATDDLVATAPTADGNRGAVVILYGDTISGDIVLSDLDPSGANGAILELVRDPGTAPGRRFGTFLHSVGRTEPGDDTDDLVIGYLDDRTTAGDPLVVLRGDGSRPTAPGVNARTFVPGRDVRIDYVTTSLRAEWGAQVSTLDDQDGDGARELVIAAYRANGTRGQVLIVSGATVGTAGVARTSDPGVTLATIDGLDFQRLGSLVVVNDPSADIDGDGLDDLMLVGTVNNVATGFIWFGRAMPSGTTTAASAPSRVTAPPTFTIVNPPGGSLGQARFVGDLDNDGLGDICWATPFDDSRDGVFEIID